MNWKELCETFGGTYFVNKTTWGEPEEVCSVINWDDFVALMRALQRLYSSGKYRELGDKLVAEYDFGEGDLDYKARAELDRSGLDVNVKVERSVASAETIWMAAEEEGLSEDEVEKAIDKFFEEGSSLVDRIKKPWIREKTSCETYFDGDYDVYVAKCEASIPGDLINSFNLDDVFDELRRAVEEAVLPLP